MILRTLDIAIAAIGIVLIWPLLVLIFIVSAFNIGSPLFIQERMGKNRKRFKLIKFRTMKLNTSSVATHLVDPSAITPLGRFLRKSKIDELPQLINVLLGQMSLVGPRPCLPNQTELIQERSQRDIFSMRPGITGIAQINAVDMSTPRKLARYDAIMLKHLNVKTYFKLIIATALGNGSGDRVTQHQA